MLGLGKTTAALLHDRQKWQALMRAAAKVGLKAPDLGQPPSPLHEVHDFGSNPGPCACSPICPPALRTDPRLWSFSTAARKLRRIMSTVRDGRRSPSAMASRCLYPNSSARIIQRLLQLVSPRGYPARAWGSAFHPSDGQQDGAGPRDRPAPRLRDRAVGRRSHGLRHARDLSRCLRRWSHYRGPAVWRSQKCPGSFREHVPMSCASRQRMGRPGAACVATPRALAADIRVARRHGHNRDTNQRGRDHQAMDRCA